MARKGMFLITTLTILALNLSCGGTGDTGTKVPLTPARNISGTWRTSTPVRVNFMTDFCTSGTLNLVGWQPWAVTFVITPGVDDNHVDVEMDFATGSFTTLDDCSGSGAGVVPEVSPLFLTGTISSTNLVLHTSDNTQVGNYNFTTDILTGTFDYTWTMVYTQEEYTDTNGMTLTRQ